jgi:hypothetical protein
MFCNIIKYRGGLPVADSCPTFTVIFLKGKLSGLWVLLIPIVQVFVALIAMTNNRINIRVVRIIGNAADNFNG